MTSNLTRFSCKDETLANRRRLGSSTDQSLKALARNAQTSCHLVSERRLGDAGHKLVCRSLLGVELDLLKVQSLHIVSAFKVARRIQKMSRQKHLRPHLREQ